MSPETQLILILLNHQKSLQAKMGLDNHLLTQGLLMMKRLLFMFIFFFLVQTSIFSMSRSSGSWNRYQTPSVSTDTRKCKSPCEVNFSLRNRDRRLRDKDFKFRIDFGDGSPILETSEGSISHTYIANEIDSSNSNPWRRFLQKFKLFKPRVSVIYNGKRSRNSSTFLVVKRAKAEPNLPPEIAPACEETQFLTINCKANATDDNDETLSLVWDFGDGTTGEGEFVTHTYQASGTYSIKLAATDSMDAVSVSEFDQVVTAPPPPTAAYYSLGNNPQQLNFKVGDSIEFSSNISTAGTGEIIETIWYVNSATQIGDILTLDSQNVGQFNVRLVVKNSFGATDETIFAVSVSPDISPSIEISTASFNAPASLNLSVSGIGNLIAPLKYDWRLFGLRSSDNVWTPEIGKVGRHLIELSITDDFGYIYKVEREFEVTNNGAYLYGEDSIDVIEGFINTIALDIYSDQEDYTLSYAPVNSSIELDDDGILQVDSRTSNTLPDSIDITISTSSSSFTKTIILNKIVPEIAVELPPGFSGSHIVNNPNSDLNNFELIVDPADAAGNSITVLTANENVYLKSTLPIVEGVEIRAPEGVGLQIFGSQELPFYNLVESVNDSFVYATESLLCGTDSISAAFTTKVLLNGIPGPRGVAGLGLVKFTNHPLAETIDIFIDISPGALGSRQRHQKIKAFLDNIDESVAGESVSLYLIDRERSLAGFFNGGTYAKVVAPLRKNIYVNLNSESLSKIDLRSPVWRPILKHELRHTEQYKRLKCNYYALKEGSRKNLASFLMENDANNVAIKYLNNISTTQPDIDKFLKIFNFRPFQGNLYPLYYTSIQAEGFQKISKDKDLIYSYPQIWEGSSMDALTYFEQIGNGSMEPPDTFRDFLETTSNTDVIERNDNLFYGFLYPEIAGGFFDDLARILGYGGMTETFLKSRIKTGEFPAALRPVAGNFYVVDVEAEKNNGRVSSDDTLRITIKNNSLDGIKVSYQRDDDPTNTRITPSLFQDDNDDFYFEVDVTQQIKYLQLFLTNSGTTKKSMTVKIGEELFGTREFDFCLINYDGGGFLNVVTRTNNISMSFENEDGAIENVVLTNRDSDKQYICFRKKLEKGKVTKFSINSFDAYFHYIVNLNDPRFETDIYMTTVLVEPIKYDFHVDATSDALYGYTSIYDHHFDTETSYRTGISSEEVATVFFEINIKRSLTQSSCGNNCVNYLRELSPGGFLDVLPNFQFPN